MYGNNIRNTQLFINDWNIMKPTLPVIESNRHNFCLIKSMVLKVSCEKLKVSVSNIWASWTHPIYNI